MIFFIRKHINQRTKKLTPPSGGWGVLACLALFAASAQPRIEQLKQAVRSAHSPAQKLNAIFDLCEDPEALPKDTLYRLALQAHQLAAASNDAGDIRKADYYLAFGYFRMNKLDSADVILRDQLPKATLSKNDQLGLLIRFLWARLNLRKQDNKVALAEYYKLLNYAEQQKDTLSHARALAGIGAVLNRTGDKSRALQAFLDGIRLVQATPYRNKVVYLYTNTAVLYGSIGNNDSSGYYARQAIAFSREAGNLVDLSNSLGMYAGYLTRGERFGEAEKAFQEALHASEQLGDPNEILTNMGALAEFYFQNKQFQKGIDISQQAIAMIKKYGVGNKLPYIYGMMGENYKAAGNYKRAAEVLDTLVNVNDSLYDKNSADALAEMQTRFDVQKKENTIIRQQLDLVKKDYLFYSAVLLLLLAVVTGWLVFSTYRRRQRQRAAQAVAVAEEGERKRIAADLHDNLGAYAASIASNVNRLSGEGMQDIPALQEVRNNSNAIVADLSDTIWALKREKLQLTAVSDRLKIFIHRVQPSYPGITIDVEEQIGTDHALSPSQGFHLFQIIREAVNNALKHSQAKHIVIGINGSAAGWDVLIIDDGIGMQPKKENTDGGNGLFNMQNRAGEAGWQIEWRANQAGGTTVSIRQLV
ncbi:MAG: hypothetical protein JO301_15810 [Chitinophagaceae bacterium]|nr:hypothetical protein [Chitinophagaceae bacterium]